MKKAKIITIGVSTFIALAFFISCHPNTITSQQATDNKPTTPVTSNNPQANNQPIYSGAQSSSANSSSSVAVAKNEIQISKKSVATAPKITEINPSGNNPTFTTESGATYPLRTYNILAVNDPYGTQWWTTNTGLDIAWNTGSGLHQTTVAIIDTGFALNHEEFANRWAINSAEQGPTSNEVPSSLNCTDRSLSLDQSCNLIDDDYDGIVDNESGETIYENQSQLNCTDQSIALDKSCNLIDDDENGYVDDVSGWDFINYDRSPQAGQTNPSGTGISHGTSVTGVLAATGNNSLGIAGVDWSTKILPLQAIDDDSYGNSVSVGEAIYYAVDRGVDIVNLSLGSTEPDDYLRGAIEYALNNDVLIVAASGNDGCDCMIYPANYPEVFAVGSYGSSEARSSFSSYGNNLDILAPGESIRSSSWSLANQTSRYSSGLSGTSFSTPLVTGMLSLAKSHQPNATWGELTNALLSTSNHSGLTVSSPWSSQIGSGYVRVNNLIDRVTTAAEPTISHRFSPTYTSGTLGSDLTYQCVLANDFPTAPLYEINLASSIYYYTIDTLDYVFMQNIGYSTRNLGRACVGMYGDSPLSIRVVNLPRETRNLSTKFSY